MGANIATAIIPVAGLGARMAPITRAVPKAMLPLVCPDGSVRPVADVIARQARQAGCERICLVTSAGQDEMLRAYFAGEPDLAERIEYVTDVEPYGFGYAVWSARQVAAGGGAMVLLGDHIHLPAAGSAAPAAQVARAFAEAGAAAVVGVQTVNRSQLHLVGVCRGEPMREGLYRCTDIVEKPTDAEAGQLDTPGLAEGEFLAHAGIYVFTDEIFDCLAPLVSARAQGQEVGLTEAQQALLARHGESYLLCRIAGRCLDVGTPAGYAAAVEVMACHDGGLGT